MEHELSQYTRQVNLHYNFWRKFRDILAEIKRNEWPPPLRTIILTKLLPLIDQLDYQGFYKLYKDLEQKRMEYKYSGR